MRNLIFYYLKKRTYPVVVISVILILIAYLIMKNGFTVTFTTETGSPKIYSKNSPLAAITTTGCILATIVPMFEFYFKMRKVNIDQMYSLPITKKKLYLTKYLIGLCVVIVPIIIMSIYCFLYILLSDHVFNLIYYLPWIFALILVLAVIYTIVTFIYTRCNTYYDGVINIVLAIFALALIPLFVDRNETYIGDYNLLYSPANLITTLFDAYFGVSPWQSISVEEALILDAREIVSLSIYLALAVVSFVLFILLLKYDKAEDATEITNSIFTYKTAIPYYVILLIAISGYLSAVVMCAIGGYIGYVIYQRSFNIKLKNAIILIICIVVGIVFSR